MGALIGQLLSIAVGIAISPLVVVAVILMLLSGHPARTSVGFAAGWIAGLLGATLVFQVVASAADLGAGSGTSPAGSWVKIVLGLVLLALAVTSWRGRPRPGEPGRLPRWMTAVEGFSFVAAFGLGVFLSGLNVKNLMLSASAGMAIGAAGLSVPQGVVAYVVFLIVASCTVLLPVIGLAVAPRRVGPLLDATKRWLEQNNATVMTVLCLLLGVNQIGSGLAGLF